MIKRISITTTVALLVCFCLGFMFMHGSKRLNIERNSSIPISDEENNELSYLTRIMRQESSYALIMALESEVPDSSKALKFVALFREMQNMNSHLSQLINESKKLNELIVSNLKNKEYVQGKQ